MLRTEPIWDTEELPIILIDFDSERVEIETASPRVYKHTLNIDVIIYCGGESDAVRVQLLSLVSSAQRILAEWQYILAGDYTPDCPEEEREDVVIDDIHAGDAVNYFNAANGDKDYVGVRLAYVAEFRVDGNASGEDGPGIPARNVMSDLRKKTFSWLPPYGETNA